MRKSLLFTLIICMASVAVGQKIRIDSICYAVLPGGAKQINKEQARDFLASRITIDQNNRILLQVFGSKRPNVYCTVDSILVSFLLLKGDGNHTETMAHRKGADAEVFRGDSSYRSSVLGMHGDSVITIYFTTWSIQNTLSLYYFADKRYSVSIRLWFKPYEKLKAEKLLKEILENIALEK